MIVDIKPSADKSLRKLGGNMEQKIRAEIALTYPLQNVSNINHDGKLKGQKNRYKIRIGNYRIIYKVESENHILITAIADRKSVYKRLFGVSF